MSQRNRSWYQFSHCSKALTSQETVAKPLSPVLFSPAYVQFQVSLVTEQ